MKPSLLAEPYANQVSAILNRFENAQPLSCDQLNFLSRHEKILSRYALDQAVKYYLKSYKNKLDKTLLLDFPKQALNQLSVHKIKQAVLNLLKNNVSHVDVQMTLEQFLQFKTIGIKELIFWHGNQFLTGAPFYPGGIPHVVYFQWGNLFGIVKLYIFPDEKIVRGNVLIDFETMLDRDLNQCVMEYMKVLENKQDQQNQFDLEHRFEEQTAVQSTYKTPTLKPVFFEISKEDHS